MPKFKFEVGDYVSVFGEVSGEGFENRIGIVRIVGKKEKFEEFRWYGIDFGKGFNGHTLNGKIKKDTGWNCPECSLTKVRRKDWLEANKKRGKKK